METKIISIADRYPEFIEYQNISIKKYVEGDYRYVVFNNAADNRIRSEINSACEKLDIEHYELFGNYNTHSSPIHAEAMNSIWNGYLSDKKGCVFWLDGDMFFISSINIGNLAKDYDIGYSPIYRDGYNIECMWTGVLFFNLDTIQRDIDFSLTNINGFNTDTAGMTYWYLKKYPDYRKAYFSVNTIYYFDDKVLITALNGCSGNINFTNNIPDEKYCDNRLFPYEKEDDNYLENYRRIYEQHKVIVKEYSFPKPYDFDLIRIEGTDNEFIFHYKSASWHERYGDGYNAHSISKKESLKNLILYKD